MHLLVRLGGLEPSAPPALGRGKPRRGPRLHAALTEIGATVIDAPPISAVQSGRAGVRLRSASLIVRIFERKSWGVARRVGPLVQEESNHLGRCVGTADIRIGSAGMSTGPRVPSPLNQPILHDRATIRARNFSPGA